VHVCDTGKKAIGVCSCVLILCYMVLRTLLSLLTQIRCRHRTESITSPRFAFYLCYVIIVCHVQK